MDQKVCGIPLQSAHNSGRFKAEKLDMGLQPEVR